MQEEIKTELQKLFANDYNRAVTDKAYFKAYMQDMLCDYPKECKLISTAIDEGVHQRIANDIKNVGNIIPVNYIEQLTTMRGMKYEIAKDVVEALLYAFGYENVFEKKTTEDTEDKNCPEKHKVITQKTVGAKKQQITKRNQKIASFLSIFGFLGLDRFYLGYYFTGILKLYTLGGFYVLWIVDAINIRKGKLLPKNADDYQVKIKRKN